MNLLRKSTAMQKKYSAQYRRLAVNLLLEQVLLVSEFGKGERTNSTSRTLELAGLPPTNPSAMCAWLRLKPPDSRRNF